ncbi:DAK2 domain-containing protein [Peptoniphilus raoultii]|uniref:DAK2 domain-containing protein n=1 Tax=Peptoniphilus raoultii TaxID=1776387 RepID=UPI0008D9E2CC|nr:DAK2 domain-containing protein [Peptoniphilus raoultii]
METKIIDGKLLREIFVGAVNHLISKKEEINALNVFPVPDGDTGTNMSLTGKSALKQIEGLKGNLTTGDVAKAAARGALMGARGNSGVILSQFLRGFSESLEGSESTNISQIAQAFKKASETTYKAVMKPVEGTILTVGRETADYALKIYKKFNIFEDFLLETIKYANISLDKTPEKLPTLKEAGVVDAGGKGLVTLLEGALLVLKGEEILNLIDDDVLKQKKQKDINFGEADLSLKYGYCTEFVIQTDSEEVEEFRSKLAPLGDCLLVVGGGGSGIIKVHVHTNHPGKALEYACELGLLQDIKIDNMRFQHREILFKEEEVQRAKKKEEEKRAPKENGFVVVSMGEGISELFKSLGCDYVVNGGQTMNPSTEDLLKGANEVNANNIFILPNNSNIILAAETARDLSEKNIFVIPSKSVPGGVAAMLAFNDSKDGKENEREMTEALKTVVDAQVTYAVRDTVIGEKEVKKGDFIGLSHKNLLAAGTDLEGVVFELIENLMDDEKTLLTLYYGEDVKKEDAENMSSQLEEKYPNMDIELIKGDQPIYYYLISLD